MEQITFKQLAIGDVFTMNGTSFDLGRIYRKQSERTYVQIDPTGGAINPTYRIGSNRVKVQRAEVPMIVGTNIR